MMFVCYGLSNFSAVFPRTDLPVHIAMGVFDGAHCGHQAIFAAAAAGARRENGIAAALTFNPHPQVFFGGAGTLKLIYPLEQRFALFEKNGLDGAVCEPFTQEFADIPAQFFFPFLKKCIPGLSAVYCGENFCFGSKRGGNVNNLEALARAAGIASTAVKSVLRGNAPVSSTRIRGEILRGNIREANLLLGENYFMTGTVVDGNKLGRTIGFPTLNTPWPAELRPPFGAYAVRAKDMTTGRVFPGIANFGIRPTVGDLNESSPLLETHLLVPAGTPVPTTGSVIRVELLDFLRRERRFASLNDLKQQLEQDKRLALEKF